MKTLTVLCFMTVLTLAPIFTAVADVSTLSAELDPIAKNVTCNPDIRPTLSSILQKPLCQELKIGESRVVKWEYYESPTGLPASYIVKRTAPDTHDVELSIDFIGTPAKPGAEMFTFAQGCVAEYNPSLISPSGQKIHLKLVPPAERNARHDQTRLTISISESPLHRSHSRVYNQNINCRSVVHELLHLTGLVDEYWSLKDDYRCRPSPKLRTVMNNEGDALEKELIDVQVESCNCPVSSDGAPVLVADIPYDSCKPTTPTPKTGCPPPFHIFIDQTKIPFSSRSRSEQNLRALAHKALESNFEPYSSNHIATIRRVDSVEVGKHSQPVNFPLTDGHIRAITRPGCSSANQKYYACAQAAYQSSAIDEQGRRLNCPQLPDYCDTDGWLK